MAVVSIGFLVIGLALPVLPLHVHQDLGLGPFVVGLVTGSQFVASLISRVGAGQFSDRRGAKNAVIAGLVTAVAGGVLYLVSLGFDERPEVSAAVLLAGRALLGGAESFIITGGVSWGLALAAPSQAGRVIAWVGMAMFAALAVGAPIGTTLYGMGGFATVAAATILVPLATLLVVLPLTGVSSHPNRRGGFMQVVGAVWMPGVGAALSSLGFGTMIGFSTLLVAERHWTPPWLLFSAFAAALVAARFFLGHVPDRLGAAKVAFVSVMIEAVGLALIWAAPGRGVGTLGAGLAGLGFALVYPALGVEAVRGVTADSRGLAMGAYTACLDVALGFGSPALGLVAGWAGLPAVFLVAAVAVLAAGGVVVRLMRGAGEQGFGLGAERLEQGRP
jgi:MFS family permease